MTMMAFYELFPEEAEAECRSITPMADPRIPPRPYILLEVYCVEPRCDCRRVMLNVVDAVSHEHVATINYAFEPPEPPFDDEGQIFLDPLNPQSDMSEDFLGLVATVIEQDSAYHDRLVRHYTMWKSVVDDPSHPNHDKIRRRTPVRRDGPKIGPNDPCPCGSGRKYKKCCRGRDSVSQQRVK